MQNYKKETKLQHFYLDKNAFEHDLTPIESAENTPFAHGRTAKNEKKHAFFHGRTTKNEKNTRASMDEQPKTKKTCVRPQTNN